MWGMRSILGHGRGGPMAFDIMWRALRYESEPILEFSSRLTDLVADLVGGLL
jgi:hypothetical protein